MRNVYASGYEVKYNLGMTFDKNAYMREWRRKNPEQYLETARRYRDNNREKVREQGRRHAAAFRARNPELLEKRERIRSVARYGLTLEEYELRLAAQGGVCAICSQPETASFRGKVRSLSVDHNHETGTVRQLLCAQCNWLVGKLETGDPSYLDAVADYLRRHGKVASSDD